MDKLLHKYTLNVKSCCIYLNATMLHLIAAFGRSLIEHVRRSALVAGHMWGTAHCVEADLPPLEEWGFKIEDARLVPHWTDTSKEDELIYKKLFNKCRCTKSKCKKLCACFKLHLECLEACKCRRSCIES